MNIDTINNVLDEEIEYAKGCGMPQFVMGMQQAKKVLNEEFLKEWNKNENAKH